MNSKDVELAALTLATLFKEVNKPNPGGFAIFEVGDVQVKVELRKETPDSEDMMKAAVELGRTFQGSADRAPGEFIRYEVGSDITVQVWRNPSE